MSVSGRLGIDVALADQAAERRLDMAARAAEAVVEVEMAEGGIEIVAPEQVDHAPAQPDAFRIAGRAAQGLAASANSSIFLLAVLCVSAARRCWSAGLASAALGEGRLAPTDESCRAQSSGNELRKRAKTHDRSGFVGPLPARFPRDCWTGFGQ